MERRRTEGNCIGCTSVQEIVQTNEQMIHEQIKIIKQLQEQINTLEIKNNHLSQQNEELTQQNEEIKNKKNNTSEEAVQTEWTFDEKKQRRELQVSTRTNIQGGSRKGSTNSDISKENLHDLVPLHSISKNEEYFSRKRKNSLEEDQSSISWIKIIQHHPVLPPAAKLREKTHHLIKKGIPHEVRHIIWPAICEDKFFITESLYFELQERIGLGWVPKEVKGQIEKDLSRSLNSRGISQRVGIEVGQVLELFHLVRPDISYIQGMTYPIIVLTLVVGKVSALRIFTNLVLGNTFFRYLYTFEPLFVQTVSRAFQLLLFDYNYDIAERLAKLKVEPQIFLVEWFFTIFSRCLSFDSTVKLWDQLLYYGEVILFRMALSIFEMVKNHIMEANYQDTVGLVQGFGSYVRQDRLLDMVIHHKLSDQKLQKYLQKAHRSISEKSL